MSVEKELKNTLHNLEIDKEKTEKTIQIIQSFLIDQHNKKDQLNKEINEVHHVLSILDSKKTPDLN